MSLFWRLFPSVYSLAPADPTDACPELDGTLTPSLPATPTGGAPDRAAVAPLLAAVATGIWKLQRRLADPATGTARSELRREYAYVRDMRKALDDSGVSIVDFTGQPYDSGLSMDVLAFEPGTADEELIKETTRPAVLWNEQRIQIPQVIVATRASDGPAPSSPE